MAESLFRDDPLKTASIGKETPEASLPFKRVPFFMWYNREFEAYLAEMSSRGFFLKQDNERRSKFEWELGEAQQCVYRLLLAAPKLEISLIETLQASGWRLAYTEKNQTFRKNIAFHIFINADLNASDQFFWENNKKTAALLNPFKESLLNLIKVIGGIGLLICLLNLLNGIYIDNFHFISTFVYCVAMIISDGLWQYRFYKAEVYFVRIHLEERQTEENGISDWRKVKSREDRQLWLRVAVGVLGAAIVFVLAEFL